MFLSTAAEIIDGSRHKSFSNRHLAAVLEKCFSASEIDGRIVTEAKENIKDGNKTQIEKLAKGLVHKCIEKDKAAFESLHQVKGESTDICLSALSECRPVSCGSAVDLFIWLVEVKYPLCTPALTPLMGPKYRQKNVVKKKNLAHWEKEFGGATAEAIARRVINKFNPTFDEPGCVRDKRRSVVTACTSGEDAVEFHGKQPSGTKAAGRMTQHAPAANPVSTGVHNMGWQSAAAVACGACY